MSAVDAPRPGLGAVVRSEWTKLLSVRSTGWTLLALVGITVGFSALVCGFTGSTEAGGADFDATAQSLVGLVFGQVAAVVLGVLCITSEYTKGGIRTTLTAVPNRARLVVAKALVVAAAALLAGLVASFTSFFVGQSLLGEGVSVSLGDPDVLRAVIGGALYLMASGLFGFALGLLLRQSAGAITGGLVLLFVLPPLIGLSLWRHVVALLHRQRRPVRALRHSGRRHPRTVVRLRRLHALVVRAAPDRDGADGAARRILSRAASAIT